MTAMTDAAIGGVGQAAAIINRKREPSGSFFIAMLNRLLFQQSASR